MCKFEVGEEVVCVDNHNPPVHNPWHLAHLLTVGRHYVILKIEECHATLAPMDKFSPWFVEIDRSEHAWHEDHFRPTKREPVAVLTKQKADA